MAETDITGASRLASGPVNDLWSFLKEQTTEWNTRTKSDSLTSALLEEVNRIGHVKTIWRFDEPTPLVDFFYPPTVMFQGTHTTIHNLELEQYKKPFVIEGQAGQGKSVLLRQIAVNEFSDAQRIPLFLELRKLTSSPTLEKKIIEWFGDFEITDGKVAFEYLAKSGKISLFLDGFDELDNSKVGSTMDELSKFVKRFPKLRIVVTSRPGTSIIRDSGFSIARLNKLCPHDVYGVLTKLLGKGPELNKIQRALSNREDILSVLTTPISVALLSFVYQGTNSIPDSLWEFYDEIFPLMFERIDQMKPGFTRERECKLDRTQMRKVFDKLSFFIHHNNCLVASEDRFVRFAEEALTGQYQEVSAQAFISDIVSVTCLLVRDGSQLSILHRSIAEFHCARFIAHLPDDTAKNVYDMLLKSDSWHNWENAVSFLKDLDPIRIRKFYLIPEIQSALGKGSFEVAMPDSDPSNILEHAAFMINTQLNAGCTTKRAVSRALDCGSAHRLLYEAIRDESYRLFNEPRRRSISLVDFEGIMRHGGAAELATVANHLSSKLKEHQSVVTQHEDFAENQHTDVIRILNEVSDR